MSIQQPHHISWKNRRGQEKKIFQGNIYDVIELVPLLHSLHTNTEYYCIYFSFRRILTRELECDDESDKWDFCVPLNGE